MQIGNQSTTGRGAYSSPTLERLGSLEQVTRGNATGNFTDKAFPIHTPKPQITFS
jgi:hypothetical protein